LSLGDAEADISQHRERQGQGASLPHDKTRLRESKHKKEQGAKPCSKNCVDPVSPKNWI
jgi:hypothetical protein